MMAIDNASGEVLAMVGGRDFALSQFNRATQSQREVGSSFKPYDYTAAVEAGAKPTDIIVDGPVSFPTPSGPYTPHNYEGDYKGAMTLLNAFAESRNIPALKLADRVGIRKVIETAHRFGVTSNIPRLPAYRHRRRRHLPLRAGPVLTPSSPTTASASSRTTSATSSSGWHAPRPAAAAGHRSHLRLHRAHHDAVSSGRHPLGHRSRRVALKHPLGGKTGTTNDYTDAWFIGFSPSVTCGTWIGFDNRQSLGEKETGAKAALPMWMDFMRAAIANKPDEQFAEGNAPKKQVVVPADTEQPKAANDSTAKAEDSDSDAAEPEPAPAPPTP